MIHELETHIASYTGLVTSIELPPPSRALLYAEVADSTEGSEQLRSNPGQILTRNAAQTLVEAGLAEMSNVSSYVTIRLMK